MEGNSEFLGSGMRFPPRVNRHSGRFEVSSGAENVKESVYMILMTGLGERWAEPGFGSRIMRYTFLDTSPTMLNMLSAEIRNAVLGQEPRIADMEVSFDKGVSNGCLIVDIRYRIRDSHTPESMVFPFYIGTAASEDADER